MLTATLTGPTGETVASSQDRPRIPRFGIFEAALTQASGDAPNPYTAIEATATLTGPDRKARTIPLFWDGGRTWRLRFSPEREGEWRWSVRSSDTGLNGRSGTFECVASKLRGSIQPLPARPHHFQYQDGSMLCTVSPSKPVKTSGRR